MLELTFFETGNIKNNNIYQVEDITETQIKALRDAEKGENRTEIKLKRLYPVICSWCGKIMFYSYYENSHGICPDCAKKLEEEFIVKQEI